ncbi:MAG TPA: patatin-like protein [Gaiellaceae bacterium]|nr:patatin-like protein [Gaiellaceae bacterium]
MTTTDASPTTQADLTLDLEEEVRLAVVMYGGVSLAIYMYGVAEELWRLVRATCPDGVYDIRKPPATVRTYDEESTEPVYRDLARGVDGAIRSRFVVDIVSGTSAGGINGVCLATALANDTGLGALKDVWVKEGDIGTLVNDPRSLEGLPPEGFDADAPPRSLLNGRRMLYRLVDALKKMSRPAPALDSPLVDELDLFVTATDLEGLELPIQLTNATARERRHANRYQFRFSRNEGRNDFDDDSIAFVAYAARATSAFPFAFEPIKLDTLPPFAEPHDKWPAYYPDYGQTINPLFESRAFSDGGILDNKPFTYATEALVRRRAALPVRRKLIYIEPDPGVVVPGQETPPKDWNAVATAQAALMGIPRSETIRGDIRALVERNRALERVRTAVARAGDAATEHARVFALLSEQSNADWAKLKLSQVLGDKERSWGPSYATYHRLKVAATIDYLAGFVVRAASIDPRSDHAWAVREIVDAWKSGAYDEEASDGRESDNAFLIRFDVPFRLRRLAFVYGKLKEIQTGDAALRARVLKVAGVEGAVAPDLETFARFRQRIGDAMDVLYEVEKKAAAKDGPVAAAIAGAGLTGAQLDAILEAQTATARADAVGAVLGAGTAVADAARAVQTKLGEAAAASREIVNAKELLGPHFSTQSTPSMTDATASLAHVLRFYYDGFEPYDLVLYPIQYATPLGETNPVDILRISPLDAHALEDLPPEKSALKGQGLHHFAAFLDEDWRRHDMAIGRLHGAECLIRALAVEGADTENLVRRAHERILRDYAHEKGVTPPPADARQWFAQDYTVRDEPSPEPTGTVKRAAPVIATIVEDVLKPGSTGATAWTTLRQILPDKPGGLSAAFSVVGVLWRLKLFQFVAMAVLVTLLAGILLIALADGGWQILGLVVLVATLTLTIAVVVAAWKLASAIRKAVVARVKAFLATART